MKIYTKTGDCGQTGLLGGLRVSKSDLTVEVCGGLDEVNSSIGLAIAHALPAAVEAPLHQIQQDLFSIGSRIAACQSETAKAPEFSAAKYEMLEAAIDRLSENLPPLTAFILPGGGLGGARLHHVRTVCRRVERTLVTLIESGVTRELSIELIYLNRLSDLLFTMARYTNHHLGIPEVIWKPE